MARLKRLAVVVVVVAVASKCSSGFRKQEVGRSWRQADRPVGVARMDVSNRLKGGRSGVAAGRSTVEAGYSTRPAGS